MTTSLSSAATATALQALKPSPRMPVLFVGHGSPMNAIEDNAWRRSWQAVGAELLARAAQPQLILCVSAHWLTRGGWQLTGMANPKTIHDFGGFPRALYELSYPAPGSPDWARQVLDTLAEAGITAHADETRGLDHGAWVPLMFMYPDADIPVLQISLHPHFTPAHHYQLGRALAPLRQQGALIVGSGSLTHNLHEFRSDHGPTQAYVEAFADWIATTLAAGDTAALLDYRARAPHAERAHPTDEHLLPLMFALGAAGDDWRARRIAGDDVRYGMLAMDAYVFEH